MKVRSKELWRYLVDSGALNGTTEDIEKAKKQYRREYKRRWKAKQKERKRELRPAFTLRQYKELKVKAVEVGLSPTAYVVALTLSSLQEKPMLPHRDKLLKVLQLLSMATIALVRGRVSLTEVARHLEEAELLLLKYLQEHS